MLVGANHERLEIVGESDIDLNSKGRQIARTVSVIKGAKRNLLGIAEIRRLNLLAVVNSLAMVGNSFDPMREFPSLFDGLGVMPDVFNITL